MKLLPQLFIISAITISACQNNIKNNSNSNSALNNDSLVIKKTDTIKQIKTQEVKFAIALSANAIQLVNQSTGSTREIAFGMPLKQLIEIVEKVLESKPTIIVNSECGAGPLKFATWDNGLTLLFQEKKKDEWLFAGWAANSAKNTDTKLTTMANVGIGTSKKETESAYVINVTKTSLGYEFSTKSNDLFGIFDGPNENAKITNLWSGVSCNFR